MARAGDVIGGKYRLVHPLGIGGMGTVWRAEHLALKQNVAIKLLDARGPNAERAVLRFQREAQIAASIRHRNIVYISDFGAGREPYLVMELLAGVPLSERMVVGEPLSVGVFLRVIEETLQGLSAVHAADVVHRDLKPENIFLVRDPDGALFPKLLDFGVSRSTERGQGHTITREGVVMGTPEYVSPEHARGRPADARSDIYSLGVVMYEALAGRLPFQADNPADLIVAMLNSQPVPLVSFRADLGQPISDLVTKAMARQPQDRFQTSEEMRAAVCALLETEGARFDALYLPKRFITPARQSDLDAVTNDMVLPPTLSFPPLRQSLLGSLRALRGPQARRRRFALGAVGFVMAGLGLGLSLWGGRSSEAGRVHAAAVPTESRPSAVPAAAAVPMVIEPDALPPNQVAVELVDVPEGASVTVDGQPAQGPHLRLAHGSGEHDIVVTSPGHVPFRVRHDAAEDGRYVVALSPLEEPRPQQKAKAARRRAAPASQRRNGLVRTPDF